MAKYKFNYTWVYDEDELSSKQTQRDDGVIEVTAEDYNSAKKIAEEEIRADEEQYGCYLMSLELNDINRKDLN